MWGYGIESHIEWIPVDRLTLTGNISSMKAGYFDPTGIVTTQQAACRGGAAGSCDLGIVTATGALAVPVYTPPLDVTAAVKYDWAFKGFTLTPKAAVQFVAREWFDTANHPGTTAPNPGVGGEGNRAP